MRRRREASARADQFSVLLAEFVTLERLCCPFFDSSATGDPFGFG
jgi:hypothetical protein